MPTPPLTDQDMREAINALADHQGNQTAAARSLGPHRCGFDHCA